MNMILPLTCGAFSALGTWALLPLLRRHVMDIPNERSNHKAPVPRAGGIAMIAAIIMGLYASGASLAIIGAMCLLAVVSFIDDMRSLPVGFRLTAQIVAVMLALSSLQTRILPPWVPLGIEYILIGIAWVWFINLTNFMDGIDGISAMEAIIVSSGICLMHLTCPWISQMLGVQASAVAASALGFYFFNRSPAKIFMGDVGSISLGFVLAYLLIRLAGEHCLISALILPAYYVGDATWTLVKRQLCGQKIWQAHSEHAYQQAVRKRFTHGQTVARIACLNLILIALAILSTVSMMAGIICIIAAYGLTSLLIFRFTHAASS